MRTWTTIDPALSLVDPELFEERFSIKHPETDPRVMAYVQGVMTGEIVACKKVRLAVERMVRDLLREEDEGCRWRFDGEKASRPIRFIEKWIKPRGPYDRMELMPWQCFFVANLFGWEEKGTGYRRYLYALLIVGSGNGKSPLVAGIALYVVSQLGIKNAEFDILANSLKQSRNMMSDVNSAIEKSPALSKKFRTVTNQAKYYEDGVAGHSRSDVPDCTINALPSGAANLDGLRPTAAAFDEVHGASLYAALAQMRRSLDKFPYDQLLLLCSTMGYVLDGVLVSEYRIGDQLLKGNGNPEVNDRRLVLIYEIDENDDFADWRIYIKANPSLGVLLSLDAMKRRWQEAQLVTDLKIDFITKTLNVFTRASAASFLDFALIEKNRDVVGLEAIRGREAFGGFDIAVSGDHCSAALSIPLDDGRFYVLPHTFVPRKVAEDNRERLDYYAQAMMGRMTIIEGDYVKQEYIFDWFVKMSDIFDIQVIGYDPANATMLVRNLETKFACEPVRQGALTLNAPMKHIKELFQDGLVVHDQNTLFEWYLNNVKLRKDFSTRDNENWVPKKMDAYSKIDGFMAWLDAHTVWLRHCPPLGVDPDLESCVQFVDLVDDLKTDEEGGGWGWA